MIYEAEELGDGEYAPIVAVGIALDGWDYMGTVGALVDSGASATVFPYRNFDKLGFAWEELRVDPVPFVGLTGRAFTRVIPGSLTFVGVRFSDGVRVMREFPEDAPPILGTNDFFRHFEIAFHWHRDPPTFEIDPI